jgi:hypothetical protein
MFTQSDRATLGGLQFYTQTVIVFILLYRAFHHLASSKTESHLKLYSRLTASFSDDSKSKLLNNLSETSETGV